ncbi:hypothetical protein [Desulfoferrobacter suflitae]|uniref:hypothetical protein n=1 Tax=Desulfoferrobacter suflitae TaxID=2865782 RepID=UPI002164EBA1|nr:hypothetical protein [Desulfoferrobacter suflitae]MCK8601842.1 hypothetical protein [Desulfoferrobacter suflitae]
MANKGKRDPVCSWVGKILICCLLGLLTAGCTSLGAKALRSERIQLNTAFQQTNDEQLLLNLIRLRYRDTPAFLEVSSISSQPSFESTVEAGAEFERADPDTELFSFGAGATYSTQPTLTYTPLQGEAFIQRLLTPPYSRKTDVSIPVGMAYQTCRFAVCAEHEQC